MKSENSAAWWWLIGWFYAVKNREPRQAERWEKRLTWAYHRHTRAMRRKYQSNGGCEFCRDPDHDETTSSCPERKAAAAKWVMLGRMWSGEEGV